MDAQSAETLANTLKWLEENQALVGSTTLMPLINHTTKRPMFTHAEASGPPWTKAMLTEYMENNSKHTAYGLLLDTLCVVDADTDAAILTLEQAAESDQEIRDALASCPIQNTKKGKHYVFARPPWATDLGFFDGARQSKSIPDLDFKTVCSTGTRSVLVVAPTKGKSWAPGRMPWSPGVSLEFMPRSLMDLVATPRKQIVLQPKKIPNTSKAKNDNVPKLNAIQPATDCQAVAASRSSPSAMVVSLVEMLSDKRMDAYSSWIELGWCLHNIDASDEMLNVWICASKRSKKFKTGECLTLWQKMRSRGLMMGTLCNWAQHDNAFEYRALMNKRVDIKGCNGSHNSVAKFAAKLLEGRHVCASSNGKLWYYFDGTLWKQDPDGIHIKREISSTLVDHVMLVITKVISSISVDDMQSGTSASTEANEAKRTSERLLKIAMKLQDRFFKESVVLELREFMYDPSFVKKLDSDRNLIAFTDGVWQLDAGVFRTGAPEDYLRHSTNYAFLGTEVTELEYAKVRRYWATLHPNEDQRSYVKKMFARQLFGDHGYELFHIHAGHLASASNGKSKFFEVLEECLGTYVRKFGVEMLTSKDRIEPGKPMPEFGNWAGVRILYCTEPNHDEKLNTGVLKDITGGEIIMYRALFSNDIQQFRPQFKVHLMCNDTPVIDGSDSGVKRRVRKIDYISRFVESSDVSESENMYLRDNSLIQSFKNEIPLKLAFFKDLIKEYSFEYEFEMPESILKNSNLYIEENDNVLSFSRECVVADVGACFTLKEAKTMYRQLGYPTGRSDTMKNDLQKALGVPCYKQKRVPSRGNINMTNVFLDFRIVAPTPKQFASTSSASELAFKSAIESKTRFEFAKARPLWLENPETGHLLELDMYDEKNRIAIEYDGPQHYEYPNPFHKTQAEFHELQQRDADKTSICRMHGVRLIRVRASTLEEEIDFAMGEFVRLGLDQLMVSF